MGGLQGRSGRVRQISPPLGFDPPTIQPVSSRYADDFVPAHIDHYIPERNHVCRVCSVAAVLYLQFTLHALLFPMLCVLYPYINTSLLCFVVIFIQSVYNYIPATNHVSRICSVAAVLYLLLVLLVMLFGP